MTESKQLLKQGIVRKLYESDQLVAKDSADILLSQHQKKKKKQSVHSAIVIGASQCDGCDCLSLCLTFVTCSMFSCGFYLLLFHGMFPSGSSSKMAATAGFYILCGAAVLLVLHILLCFGRVALYSSPSQRELELFTAFSRQCKMLTGVQEVEFIPEDSDDADENSEQLTRMTGRR